jgi:hypothetical protein
VRVSISTPLPESEVAEYLAELAKRVEPKGVKVGSYPRWGKKRNTVTLVGRYVTLALSLPSRMWWCGGRGLTRSARDKEYLESITPEVLVYVKGTLTTPEKEKEEDMADTEE